MTPDVQNALHRQLVLRRWNELIPECAVSIEWMDDHIRYLHPTKGYRRVSFRRLGVVR